MELSSWAVYTAAEILFILVLTCIVLLFHTKNLKSALTALQVRLTAALADLKELKENQSNGDNLTPQDYALQLDAKLSETQDYYQAQEGATTILEDLAAEGAPARKAAALRYHFLNSEKIAATSGSPDWQVLASHYERLAVNPDLPSAPTDAGNLSYNEQREEVERFKRLFTTMESQWQHAKSRAEQYYHQLLNLIGDSQDPKFLELKSMAESQLEDFQESTNQEPTSADHADVESLKAINAKQQEEIASLQARLQFASSDEERAELIADLERQLAQQLKFMKESDICIDLLEQELRQAAENIAQLERKLKKMPITDETPTDSADKQQFKKKISQLESENEQLVHLAEHNEAELKSKLSAKDAEIKTLRTKYAELVKRVKASQSQSSKAQ